MMKRLLILLLMLAPLTYGADLRGRVFFSDTNIADAGACTPSDTRIYIDLTDLDVCRCTAATWDCHVEGGTLADDSVTTAKLDDGVDTPLAGEFIQVDAADTTQVAYRTDTETRTDLGLVIGTNVQAWDAELDTIAALAETNGNVMFVAGGAWTSDATPAIDCTDCTNIPAGSHTGTITWGGTSILETGAAFQFGDASDATVTHTYANTGTNNTIAYSSGVVNVTAGTLQQGGSPVVVDSDIGSTVQAWDAELDTISGLAETSGNVMFAVASAWASDATPAIDCTDCTNIPAAANLNDVGDVTLTTPADGAVLCFTGTASASVDCTPGGDITATEDAGTLTVAVVDDSHNHVITNVDAFTAAQLQTQTSDVTTFYTEDTVVPVVDGGTGVGTSTGTGNVVLSASPTFTGTPVLPTPFTIGAISMTSTATELNLLDGITVLSGSNTGDEPVADLTTSGTIEIATGAETNTGTDATRAVSPDGLDDWTGSAQVTTLGTIATGVWSGTDVAVVGGGTGASTLTDGQILVGNGTGAVTALPPSMAFVVLEPDAADAIDLLKAPAAITITDIHCITDAGTVVIDIQECTSTGATCVTVDATISCDSDGAEDDGAFTNGTIDAADWVHLEMGTVTTAIQVAITIYYTVD